MSRNRYGARLRGELLLPMTAGLPGFSPSIGLHPLDDIPQFQETLRATGAVHQEIE
jgi:hypothetical protein